MALQPAAGARDLHPREVDSNRRLCDQLAEVYRLWGYQEVAPPTIERLDTLEAGGAIDANALIRLAAGEPLGLRPELTASIARAAGTRLAARPRPLRLWACGSIYRSVAGEGGGRRISEELQSGVELLGVPSAAADGELMHLLLAAAATLGLRREHAPTLLVGHHGLLDRLLEEVPTLQRPAVRRALTDLDALALTALPLPEALRRRLAALLALRGEPAAVLYQLEQWLGPVDLLDSLAATLEGVADACRAQGLRLQLDPTFQPHFDLYDGLVLKLVCQGADAPVAIASGGRYDALVGRFSSDPERAAGTGFAFAVETIRELLDAHTAQESAPGPWLVAATAAAGLRAALGRMAELHAGGEAAELCVEACPDRATAEERARERGCRGAQWIAA
ncbi:ATP phosphoribosyltransferase regulatory subunit [Cyanobium sp. FGCU-6]|jgi:ATP phosphoribosyltransferase regulatory subunit|nr:ATP phosphoribosyltransferase regulatory subunit [Cyanobium sp. FGCU6]